MIEQLLGFPPLDIFWVLLQENIFKKVLVLLLKPVQVAVLHEGVVSFLQITDEFGLQIDHFVNGLLLGIDLGVDSLDNSAEMSILAVLVL